MKKFFYNKTFFKQGNVFRVVRRGRRVIFFLSGAAFLSGLFFVYHFNPGECRFFPPCPFYLITGFYCSGCGSTRALNLLLHGNVAGAIAKNPVAPFVLTFAGFIAARGFYYSAIKKIQAPLLNPLPVRILLAVIVGYGIIRNIPVPPFTLLAP